jgi:hypothetical protein
MKKILIILALAFAATGCSSPSSGEPRWEYKSLVLNCVAFVGGDPLTGLECIPVFDKVADVPTPRRIDDVLTEMGEQSWELVSTDVQIEGGLGRMPRGEMQKYLYSMVFKRQK